MKAHPRFPSDGGRRGPKRVASKSAKKRAAAPRPAAGPLPADMIRLKNGRIVRKGEFVVFVRLRSGGPGVYILSEDLIYLPPDQLIGEIEIDRGISLDSPLVLHPEAE